MPDDRVVLLRAMAYMTDAHLREFTNTVRWSRSPRLVIDNEPVNEAYRLYEQTGDERLRTVM